MTQKQVEQILDLTRPGWREEFTAEKFETFQAMVEAMRKAVDEGCKQLDLNPSTVH